MKFIMLVSISILVGLIKIPTNSQTKPEMKEHKYSNEKPLDNFYHRRIPYHFLVSPTTTT